MPEFSDSNIAKMFGAEAAEDEPEDRFRQYFISNRTYENLISDLPLRILVGHKGIGKSALLTRARLRDTDDKVMAIWIQPGDIEGVTVLENTENFTSLVEYWKRGLLAIITRHILGELGNEILDKEKLGGFAKRITSFVPTLTKILSDKAGAAAPDFNQAIIENFLRTGNINIYIDDVDRGWSATKSDIKNISALLSAMRDISGNDHRIRFRLGLRTDVYFLVRTSDESTDKVEGNVIWLSWDNHDILCIIAKRIEAFFGINRDQSEILKLSQSEITNSILSKVIAPRFEGAGHWSHAPIHVVLMSLVRQRPRDLVKLMHGAAKKAANAGSSIISSSNLENAFESYSNERLQDLINEFRSELPDIERLLLEMKPTKRERTTAESFLFTNDRLLAKLREIMNHVNFTFTNGRPITPRSLAQFLYKIDFITARKQSSDGKIDRKYFDRNRFLASEFVEFGYEWEIHPAYRWALQPQDVGDVIASLNR